MDIRDIDWGDDSAESDENLMEYFIDFPIIRQLRKKRKRLILGRKGSGKSAFRKKLISDLEESLNIEIMPNENIIKSISNDNRFEKYENSEILFQYIWLVYIYDKLFEELANNYKDKVVTGSKEYIVNYVKSHNRYNSDLIGIISDLFEKIKLKAGNFGDIGFNIEKQIIDCTNSEEMEFHLKNVIKDEKEIVVYIDDLDLGWNNSEVSNDLLLGLLNAINHLKKVSNKIHTFLFIRTDMYKILMSKTQHSDKFRDVAYIKWDNHRLEELIEQRIKFNYLNNNQTIPENVIKEVFPDTVGKTLIFNWLIERTLNRPRELIQLCRIYTDNLYSNSPDSEVMKLTEKTYSDWKLEDVCNEYSNKYKGLNQFFETWKKYNFRIKYHLKLDEINEKIEKVFGNLTIKEDWYSKSQKEKDYQAIINILYEIGFLGDFIQGGDGGSNTIYVTIDDTHEPSFNEVQIHPCFRKAVGTVTRIR